MQQLILGTAQLGMDYGMNNFVGKPSIDKVYNILDTAYENGIKILDTAAVYGDSEKIIGIYMKEKKRYFNIFTKLPKLNENENIFKQIDESINNSLNKLNITKIDYYFIHSFNDLILYPNIINYLEDIKEKKIIGGIGVSIYDVDELEFIIKNLHEKIDIIQIPFNVFDLRWLKKDLLKKAEEMGIKIAARSVFLQGLFFTSKINAEKIHPNTYGYVNKLKELSDSINLSVEQIAIDFVKVKKEVDFIVIGCETQGQLENNIKNMYKEISFNNKDIEYINKNFNNIEKTIIDPRMWRL